MVRPPYPPARRLSLVEEVAPGCPVPDPYRWLEDADRDETRDWSAAQDALFQAHRDGWETRSHFRERLVDLLAAGSACVPVWRGGRCFLLRDTAEGDSSVLIVVGPDGRQRVLLDPLVIDPSGKTVFSWRPSWDGDLLAYQLSPQDCETSELWVMDVCSGRIVDGPVARTRHSPVAWLAGSEGFYYVAKPGSRREEGGPRLRLHRIGGDPARDACVFGGDCDRTDRLGVGVSPDGRWLWVSVTRGAVSRNDLWLADLSRSGPERPDLRIVHEGSRTDAHTSLEFGCDGRIYALTDHDAPNGRICVLDPRDPWDGPWRELIAEDPGAVLDDCAVLDGPELDTPVLLVVRTRHAVTELTLHDADSGALAGPASGKVALPGLGTVQGVRRRPEGGHEAWFAYGDFTTPAAVYRLDARDGRLSRWTAALGAVVSEVPSTARTRQVVFAAKDGTALRMFLVTDERDAHAGNGQAPAPQPRPTILFVYGGFGASLRPAYSPVALAWVHAGGVYAVANVRGGGEEGARWHRAGQGRHKQHTFDDVHAAAEWLVSSGWTTPDQLVLSGGSHGGLAVGAVLTQHPDACAAVVCSSPVLDMVRYERFGMGHMWTEEFGTASDAEQLERLLSYSPYHQVREGVDYPATLFTCPDVDPRVDALHVRKMAAALQHATAGPRPVLVRREVGVGHSSGSPSSTLELWVDTLAFAAAATGLVPKAEA